MKNHVLLLYAVFSWVALPAQTRIQLSNPSFEDVRGSGRTPSSWSNCGWNDTESPPDIQPGAFNAILPAQHGFTYLGMVVRDNATYESVGQRLGTPLLQGNTYAFSLWLARSEAYLSKSRLTDSSADYMTPVKLRIFGGNDYCDRKELLAETPVITGYHWQEYGLRLTPVANCTHIVLEAYYEMPDIAPYNGNILVDHCSDMVLLTDFKASPSTAPDEIQESEARKNLLAERAAFTRPDEIPEAPARETINPSDPKTIRIKNPSFEYKPSDTRVNPLPAFWETLPRPDEILPRTHPELSDKMKVKSDKEGYIDIPVAQKPKAEAYDGERYMSLVTRKDGTRQWISQALEKVLEKDSVYVFSLFLMHTGHLKELQLHGENLVDFRRPVKLRVWGGNEVFQREEVLSQSPLIDSKTWKRHLFALKPQKKDYAYLTLEAWYGDDKEGPYNGHILIDQCSNITRVSNTGK